MADKTRDTKKLYTEKVRLLMIKAGKEFAIIYGNGDPLLVKIKNKKGKIVDALNITDTIDWACNRWALNLSKSTWRFYRSALKYQLEVQAREGKIERSIFDSFIGKMNDVEVGEVKKKRTSATKLKNISVEKIAKLIIKLNNRSGKWGVVAANWFLSGVYCGLRPAEWIGVKIGKGSRGVLVLKVENAKTTNGRSHGETRTIRLDHLNKDERDIVVEHLKNIRKNDYTKMYNGCAKAIQSVSRDLWPSGSRYPTLYTGRHQFAANSKASGSSVGELAALMGHGSDQTAGTHYGKKRYGSKGRKPIADEDEVNKVRNKGSVGKVDKGKVSIGGIITDK
jgi:integrase